MQVECVYRTLVTEHYFIVALKWFVCDGNVKRNIQIIVNRWYKKSAFIITFIFMFLVSFCSISHDFVLFLIPCSVLLANVPLYFFDNKKNHKKFQFCVQQISSHCWIFDLCVYWYKRNGRLNRSICFDRYFKCETISHSQTNLLWLIFNNCAKICVHIFT